MRCAYQSTEKLHKPHCKMHELHYAPLEFPVLIPAALTPIESQGRPMQSIVYFLHRKHAVLPSDATPHYLWLWLYMFEPWLICREESGFRRSRCECTTVTLEPFPPGAATECKPFQARGRGNTSKALWWLYRDSAVHVLHVWTASGLSAFRWQRILMKPLGGCEVGRLHWLCPH